MKYFCISKMFVIVKQKFKLMFPKKKKTTGKSIKWAICFSTILSKVKLD